MNTPSEMRAMVFEGTNSQLTLKKVPVPQPLSRQVLIKVDVCGICRTDLHLIDNELPGPKLPVIPGHEIVGTIVACGEDVGNLKKGDRVGVPWLGYTCGECRYCLKGKENLCAKAKFTGYTLDGGFAEYTVAYAQYVFPLPPELDAAEAAPLLCAGLIGYRSYRMTGEGVNNLGLYGFGAAAHILAQVATWEGKKLFAFTRPGDEAAQAFARRMGAAWAGGSDEQPPEPLDAAILFAPVGSLVPAALKAVDKGGVVVCGGIHMSDIPSFPYHLLWEERVIRSVANLERRDGDEFLALAPKVPVHTHTQPYPLEKANEALTHLREGLIEGAAVLNIES